MSSIVYKQIDEQIRRSQSILLLTDERIDGDTVGATLGMYHVLSAMNKGVVVFSPREIPKTFSFLSGIDRVAYDESIFNNTNFDLIIIFDCADGAYLKNLLPKFKRKAPLIVIDHHITNPKYGFINLIEPGTASASGVLWRFIKTMKYPVSREAAQCILTGICTDTDMFLTTSTNAACLDAAHELSRHGARLQEIVRETMMNKSIPALKLWGLAFERLHHNDEFNAIATAITLKDMHELGAQQEDLSGLINFINSMIDGVDTVLVYYEKDDGSVKGSLRSHTVDVASLAQKYGGGGHIRASGFSIQNAKLEEKDGKWFAVAKRRSAEASSEGG